MYSCYKSRDKSNAYISHERENNWGNVSSTNGTYRLFSVIHLFRNGKRCHDADRVINIEPISPLCLQDMFRMHIGLKSTRLTHKYITAHSPGLLQLQAQQ
jgi:hypothetical protein